ncbi:VOC family protein [Actinoplanes bogorensis]|uniref:VOC family protein n=1 Tax=Paractinoplanes bogorensis TaxID=1610840 RepID=A0ABS5YPY6_9ACTN|nr:VOC family protein [Actinoplanes bogorensis]MBU2665515.1 VOC family protein [Actinoplanes bogorensis]
MTSIPARLTVVTLGVHDMPVMRAFYRGLGWPEADGADDGWSSFLLGGVLLALFPVGDLAAEAVPEGAAPLGGWSGVTLACNVDSRDEVGTAYAAAVAAGATAVAEPVDRPWGGRSGYIADPEGNRWEIAWAGGARFDGRGALLAFGG